MDFDTRGYDSRDDDDRNTRPTDDSSRQRHRSRHPQCLDLHEGVRHDVDRSRRAAI